MSRPLNLNNDTRPLQASRSSQVILDNYNQYAARYHNPYANYPPSMALLPPSMHTPEAYLSSHIGSTNTNAYPNNSNQNSATRPPASNRPVANNPFVASSESTLARPSPTQQSFPSMSTAVPCPLCGTSCSTYAELVQHMSHRHADYTGNYPFINQYAHHNSMFQPTSSNAQLPSYLSLLLSGQQLMQQPSQTNNPMSAGNQPQPKLGLQVGARSNAQSSPFSPPHMTPLHPPVPSIPISVPPAPPSAENTVAKQAAPDVGLPPPVQKKQPPSMWSDKNIECHICNVFCSTQDQLDIHFNGHKHKKRALIYADFMKASSTFGQQTISETSPNNWYCSRCRVAMDSMNSVLQHLESVKHSRHFGPSVISLSKRANNPGKDKNGAAIATAPQGPTLVPTAETSVVPSVAQSARAPALSSNPLTEVVTAPPATSPSSIQNDVLRGLKALSANKTNPFPSPVPTISKVRSAEVNPLDVANAKLASATAAAHGTASLSCIACHVTCNSTESLALHLASQRHKRRIAIQSGAKTKLDPIDISKATSENAPAAPPEPHVPIGRAQNANTTPTPTRPDVDMFCDVCRVPICGRRNYEDHIRGRLHCRNLNLKKLADTSSHMANTEMQNEQRPASSSLSSTTKNAIDKDVEENTNIARAHTHGIEENSAKTPGTGTQQEVQVEIIDNISQPEQGAKNVQDFVEESGSKKKCKEGDSGTTDSSSGLAQLAAASQAAKKTPARRKRGGGNSRSTTEKLGTNPPDENGGGEKPKSNSPSKSGRRNSSSERGIKNSRGRVDNSKDESDSANAQSNPNS